jgi:hypothetical protein
MKKFENLGVSIEKKQTVGPFYVISKMDVNGVAAKSKHILMCNENIEAGGHSSVYRSSKRDKRDIKKCLDTMELHIAKKPT